MDTTIIQNEFRLNICGFSAVAVNNEYGATGKQLMDKMWQIIKTNNIKNKGLNVWVYEPGGKIFTGVELVEPIPQDTGLEQKTIHLFKYCYYKHIGPYQLLKNAYQKIKGDLQSQGLETSYPSLEIYGHWNNDETKFETEILISLK